MLYILITFRSFALFLCAQINDCTDFTLFDDFIDCSVKLLDRTIYFVYNLTLIGAIDTIGAFDLISTIATFSPLPHRIDTMSIYFNTNPMESRGLLAFQRTTSTISGILQRLETGYRINSAKDDPVGLVIREGMRADMKGMQAAISNTGSAMNLLTAAEGAMSKIASLLNGDPEDSTDTGLLGLLNNQEASADAKRQGIEQVLSSIDSISQSTVYGGRQIIGGALDYNVISKGDDRNNISDIRVTRAQVNGTTPLEIDFTVQDTAKIAGVKMDVSTPLAISDGDPAVQLVFTDSNGKSVAIELAHDDADGTNDTNFTSAQVLSKISQALQENPSVALTARVDSDTIYVESLQKGASQQVTADGGGLATIEDINDSTNTGNTAIVSQGSDWVLSGLDGTTTTSGDYVTIYSNLANFSANLADAEAGDSFQLQVAGGTAFQLGKDVTEANRFRLGIGTISSSTLGGTDGKLADLRSLDYSNDADIQTALNILNGAITDLASQRGSLGSAMGTLETNKTNIEDQLAIVTGAEAEISNTDVALESSRLARQELIAQSSANAILFSRSFAQFAASSLLF